GDRDAAARDLVALGRRKEDDYRLQLVSALLALETALAAPCPLPALEGPAFEWEEKPAAWPAPLVAAIQSAARSKVANDLADEYKSDRALIDGLSALASGQVAKAADLLRQKPLPACQAAWCRAAYLDRRFAEVRDADESKGRRERFGAALALAAGSGPDLELLLPEAGADEAIVHAALARIEGIGGVEAYVEAGMK